MSERKLLELKGEAEKGLGGDGMGGFWKERERKEEHMCEVGT